MPETFKEPLKEMIREHIYSAIMNEVYVGGSQIKELHLSEELGVSRAPIREALGELVSMGILEQRSRKGVFVKEITSRDIFETYEAKGVYEGFLASEFALHASKSDIDFLQSCVEKMSDSRMDRKRVVKIGEEFHSYCLKYGTNSVVANSLQKVNIKSQMLFYKNWVKLYTQDEVKTRHQKIVDAIKSKEKKRVEQTIREHYFETGTKIVILKEVR